MTIMIKRFGDILVSRPEGREAALVLLASDLDGHKGSVQLNFDGVSVLTPSWIGEFLQTLSDRGIKSVEFIPSQNASVTESIKVVLDPH